MTQSSAPTSTPLYIFTTSQAPLAARYPRPAKPTLIVPPLIHRSLHQALDLTPPSLGQSSDGGLVIPHPDLLRKHDLTEDGETEVTLKIHLVGEADAQERHRWVEDALGLLDTHLGIKGADTLLVGFKGVDYKGKKTVDSESTGASNSNHVNVNGNGDAKENSTITAATDYTVPPETEQHIVDFWKRLVPTLTNKHRVKRIGAMYLPLSTLRRLRSLDQDDSGLAVNSLDTPDCHHLPKDFTGWARENGVQLWAGGGGEGSGQSNLSLCVSLASAMALVLLAQGSTDQSSPKHIYRSPSCTRTAQHTTRVCFPSTVTSDIASVPAYPAGQGREMGRDGAARSGCTLGFGVHGRLEQPQRG